MYASPKSAPITVPRLHEMKTQGEKIVQRGLLGHRRKHFNFRSGRGCDKQVPRPHAVVPGGDLGLDFGDAGKRIGG